MPRKRGLPFSLSCSAVCRESFGTVGSSFPALPRGTCRIRMSFCGSESGVREPCFRPGSRVGRNVQPELLHVRISDSTPEFFPEDCQLRSRGARHRHEPAFLPHKSSFCRCTDTGGMVDELTQTFMDRPVLQRKIIVVMMAMMLNLNI